MVICCIYKKGGSVMSNYKNPQRYKNGDSAFLKSIFFI